MDENRYFNEVLYRMEEIFWHELSDCAPWKTEFVGIDFIQARDVSGRNADEVIASCIEHIKAAGLASDVGYAIRGKGVLLKLHVTGCRMALKEVLLRKSGIKPYNCPLANMIRDQLIEKLGYETTYLAALDAEEQSGCCNLKVAIYETPAMVGVVSDWSKE